MTKPKTKPVPGHRCQRALMGFEVACECGWRSATWYGKGGRGSAYAEWRQHIAKHAPKAQVQEP